MSRIAKIGAVALGTGAVVLSGAGLAAADAGAKAAAVGSPGVLSGNVVQVPINAPINVCGNTVTVFGGLERAVGNVCKNDGGKDKKDDKKARHRHGR
ncbi:chaplin [Streptomyces sp. HC44]|uniref:Chaplin n=1 Tax=Streptomyces scabichelini TaxID=2711217 RepID=A0A6G4VCQ5_9ACTN|nr:chaplin [Streptomyces scabichelini]NGO11685.1 chaplin [Streptomyces scabichelini]